MLSKLTRQAPLTLSVLGVAVVTLLVKRRRTAAFDRRWSSRIGNGKPLALDISRLAQPQVGAVEAVVLAAWPGLRRSERILALAAPLIAGLTGHGLKRLIPRRRPGWAGLSANGKQSFPSTHAAHAAALAFAAAHLARNHGAGTGADAAAAAVLAAIGFARLRARAHWPTDVMAGALLGIGSVRLVSQLRESALRAARGF